MALLLFYIMLGTLLILPKFTLGISYNLDADTDKTLSCYSSVFKNSLTKPKEIKLLLDKEHLNVTCHLSVKNVKDTEKNKLKNMMLYSSSGLAPSIEIFNSTFSKVFYFRLVQEGNSTNFNYAWSLEVLRQSIAHNTDIAPTEEWYVKFSMHHGLNMFTTEGTLLDFVREPILQWNLGPSLNVSRLIPNIINVTVAKSPCASDVDIIGLIFNPKVKGGIYIGLTWSAFMTRDTNWYNLTGTICVLLEYDCAALSLLNVILTNKHIVFLTTLGIFISEDLRYGTFKNLKFRKPNFCGFEKEDYFRAKIWYNRQCLANEEAYEDDYISLTFDKDKTLSQESTCFYSNNPFMDWYSCLPYRIPSERLISRRVVCFLDDHLQNTGIGILTQQGSTLISVNKLKNHKLSKKRKFPDFWFQDRRFEAFGMFFHPNSHFLYAYGNQVWLSEDGGNTFKLLLKLTNETVVKTDACVYTQAIIFVTDKGSVFYTNAGLFRYARLTSVQSSVFNVNFDHLGVLNLITLNQGAYDSLSVTAIDVTTLLKNDDLSFYGPLAPQYITEEQIAFFSHVPVVPRFRHLQPRFYSMMKGKALQYSPGGSGIINRALENNRLPHFLSSVIVDVLDRFPIETSTSSPCLLNTLNILPPDPGTTAFKLQLGASASSIFRATDIEKTIVMIGFSSFLILNVTGPLTALADAVMPQLVPFNTTFQSGQWFMYDFGTTNGKRWKIACDKCRYTIQQFEDLPVHAIKYLDLGSKRSFSFRVTPVNPPFQVFHVLPLKIIVGKPNLLDINIASFWDDNDSYTMKIHVQSKFFEQGKTSIAVLLTEASLICDVTSLTLTLKNSCSYLKVMHYILSVQLSASDWLLQMDNASKYLKNLPVNYRPPSRLGIAVPLTENFYNADPSKPRMRDYFQGSKTSGTYKQCANKTSRSECSCTDNMKLSFFVAFTDCKEKAIRMKHPIVKLPLRFTVENEDGAVNLSSPYFVTITEVNNRTNWEISGTNATPSMLKMRKYLAHRLNKTLYNPDGLTLSIYGSELFHFRVATIPGISFCGLYDEFQIYVDDAPLAFPGVYLITSITGVLIGSIIFVAYILEVYEIHVWVMLKQKLARTNKVSPKVSLFTVSTISTNTSEK